MFKFVGLISVLLTSLTVEAAPSADVEALFSVQTRPETVALPEWQALRGKTRLSHIEIAAVMKANVSAIFYGTNLPGLPVHGSDPHLDRAIFRVLEGTTIENVKAASGREFHLGQRLFAGQFLGPALLLPSPTNMIFVHKLLPYLMSPNVVGDLTIAKQILSELNGRRLRAGFRSQIEQPATDSQYRVWIGLLAYGFYYLDPSTITNLHWEVGQDYFKRTASQGLSDMLKAVAEVYVQFPESEIGLEDKSEAAGMSLIRLLKADPSADNLETLALLLNRSRNDEVRNAAQIAIEEFSYASDGRFMTRATEILTANRPLSFWDICGALLKAVRARVTGQTSAGAGQ